MTLDRHDDVIGIRAHLGQNQPRADTHADQEQGRAQEQGSSPRHSVADAVALGVHAGIECGALRGSIRSDRCRVAHQGGTQRKFLGLLSRRIRGRHRLILAREDVQGLLVGGSSALRMHGPQLERRTPREQH